MSSCNFIFEEEVKELLDLVKELDSANNELRIAQTKVHKLRRAVSNRYWNLRRANDLQTVKIAKKEKLNERQ